MVGVVLWILLGFRVSLIQIRDGESYRQRAHSQQHRLVTLDPHRGRIFDRNQEILALNVEFESFGIKNFNPALFNDSEIRKFTLQVSQITGEDSQVITDRLSSKSDFAYLLRWVPPEVGKQIRQLRTYSLVEPYIRIEKEYKRIYPYQKAAGQILGFSIDGIGKAGFEKEHNDLLSGVEGQNLVKIDAQRRPYSWLDSYYKPARDGSDVMLTIDIAAQIITEEVLENTIEQHDALGGMVIMMDPRNGDILAMASAPDFDPNIPGRYPFESQKIRPVVDIYEPGSTFKVVAATAALETGVFSIHDRIDTSAGRIVIGSQTISDHQVFDELSVQEIIEHSSNVGIIKIALDLGAEKFYKFVRAFGFGIKTGVQLPGEARGILHKPQSWSKTSLPTMSIGYGISVTGLQLATAYCAVANGGYLLQPRIVKSVENDSMIHPSPRKTVRKVMSEETAETLRKVFAGAVERGTGKKAAISGFKVAGKTGTAWKTQENGRGYTRNYRSSFAGMFPAEEPEIVILVMIDDPKKQGFYGSTVAAPVFHKIIERLVHLPGGPVKSLPESENGLPIHLASINSYKKIQSSESVTGTDYSNLIRESLLADVASKELENPISRIRSKESQILLPRVVGMSTREAVKTLAEKGIEATIVGTGYVQRQSPEPGNLIYLGDRCIIECNPYN